MRGRKTADRQFRRARRGAVPVVALTMALIFCAAEASAAVRYAEPGGNNVEGSECLQANPCSLFNAASRFAPGSTLAAGDEVVVEPGSYSGAGDLGEEEVISPLVDTSVHGATGSPRPKITGEEPPFILGRSGTVLSHVEVVTTGQSFGFLMVAPGVVDDVIVRASGSDSAACFASIGIVRDSACLSTGPFGAALLSNSSSTPQIKLRNLTAIATGEGSHGLEVIATGTAHPELDAIGVLARGAAADVFAQPFDSGEITIALSHSDFADVETAPGATGTVTITAPGQGDANITAEPLLAPDGYHELFGSPTIDAGALDASSGASDVDGEQRSFGKAPDIGADEFQLASTTSLSCNPASAVVGAPTTCTATVSASGPAPSGTVKLSSDGPGSFAAAGACTLAPAGQGESSCHLPYTPSALGAGAHSLTASYGGDAVNAASQGSTSVRVLTKGQATPNTRLKRKPRRKSASARATFTFAADLPGSRFQCKLDRKHFRPCRSPLRLKGLKRGRHTFSVRAVGPTGIADPTPARFRWRVL
jgi:Bacterial Ig-like domain (group 3)